MSVKTVVIIEDDELISGTLSMALELEGYTVHCFENAKVALDSLDGIEPCLILLDLMMPVMTGWQFLDYWAKQLERSMIPVVVMSAVGSLDALTERGAKSYLRKPVDLNVLLSTVRSLCKC